MSHLKARLVDLISTHGPISVAEYMALCLYDPDYGYYMTRDPFGRAGDFTTAPEISQMFGELVGVWIAQAWMEMGSPDSCVVAEIGPGRGTLMKDLTRAIAQVAAPLSACARFCLVEVSPALTSIQAETVAGSPGRFEWHSGVDQLPDVPAIIVGNEIFDAIPMRQYVRQDGAWRERVVGLGDHGSLRFMAGMGAPHPDLLPPGADRALPGEIVELAPARTAMMEAVAAQLADNGGMGLFIDYGYLQPGTGDTLQALHHHQYDDPLDHPGEADLTSHVDFAALAAAAGNAGLRTATMTQADFLLKMGLLERAGRLGRTADPAAQQAIRDAVERLAGPDQMGDLFKVLCIGRTLPHPFSA